MKILITNHTLDARAGTEMYVRDLAFALQGRGLSVACYSPKLGLIADELRGQGIEVVDDLVRLSEQPDLIHAHHFTAAAASFFAFPGTPALFVCHGLLPWPETPLIQFAQIKKYVAVDLASQERLAADMGLPVAEISILRNGIDLKRFQRKATDDPARQKRALVFSNQAHDTSIQPLRAACTKHGIVLDVRGAGVGDPMANPEEILGNYGLVFGKARAAMEAMACGCNVILADYGKWGGAVTVDNFDQLHRLNFGLRAMNRDLDEQEIANEIAGLNWTQGPQLARLIAKHSSLDDMVDQLVAHYQAIVTKEPTPHVSRQKEAAQFIQKLSPLLYERDELATRLYEETKLRLANEATNAGLLVQAMVTLREGSDQVLVRRIAEQVLLLQPGHPIALDVLADFANR